MSVDTDSDADLETHLSIIEREVRRARGEGVHATPWDYALPSASALKEMREACDLSRAKLAELMGYKETTIRQIETNQQPPGREYIQKALTVYRMEWDR